MRGAGTVAGRLLTRDALPVLQISEADAARARALLRERGMTRGQELDLADPVITRVERFGDRPAVSDATSSLSYAELAGTARRLATQLAGAGAGAGTVVAVGGARSALTIAAFLAIELLGAVYVPADPTWPAGRVADVLEQSGAVVLLATDGSPVLARGAALAGRPLLAARTDAEPWPHPPVLASLDQPRYVLFTSGSTGRPKGAVVEHLGMLNHLWAKIIDLGMTGDDVLAFTAPLGFDISIWQMICPLLLGGRVAVVDDRTAYDSRALAAAVEAQGITVLELVPTMVRLLLEEVTGEIRGLRWMIATGEELPTELARHWLAAMPGTALLNAYGPTECSDDVTHHTVTAADLDLLRLPIGGPIVNADLYVLRRLETGPDAGGAAGGAGWTVAEPGEDGELFVGGICVGRGYLGDPERTRAAFFQDPFTPGGKLYRTGDAVRLLPQGTLQYLGRVDRQVKIAGVRTELGEIEAVLQRHPVVAAVAVVVHEL